MPIPSWTASGNVQPHQSVMSSDRVLAGRPQGQSRSTISISVVVVVVVVVVVFPFALPLFSADPDFLYFAYDIMA